MGWRGGRSTNLALKLKMLRKILPRKCRVRQDLSARPREPVRGRKGAGGRGELHSQGEAAWRMTSGGHKGNSLEKKNGLSCVRIGMKCWDTKKGGSGTVKP